MAFFASVVAMPKKLQPVGFFSDLPHGDATAPPLSAVLGRMCAPDSVKIAAYLHAGAPFIVAPQRVGDVLNPDSRFATTLGVLTDGAWAWPTDLGHYVLTYAVDLPAAFVDHVRACNYQIGAVDVTALVL